MVLGPKATAGLPSATTLRDPSTSLENGIQNTVGTEIRSPVTRASTPDDHGGKRSLLYLCVSPIDRPGGSVSASRVTRLVWWDGRTTVLPRG